MLVFSSIGQPAAAQYNEGRYFPETGKWVRGEFLKFYLKAPNPGVLFGLPISDEMIDSTGTRVQYFERARFELKMTEHGLEVKLANLGWLSIEGSATAADVPGYSPSCRYFPRTGKSVCYGFLKFYDEHNGAVYFGDPLTNMEIREGGFVQYFENARLEYHANAVNGATIKITDLGRIAYIKYVGAALPENKGASIIANAQNLNGLHLHAFVSKSMIPAGAQQSVTVVMHDQASQPASGAWVSVLLEYPTGRRDVLSRGTVDADGIYRVNFEAPDLKVNDVLKVLVQSEYMGVPFFTSGWFRIWY